MEHFIKNIEITNFKSIRHAEIKDCRRVNVFVGPPNVGKSNILEALSGFSFLSKSNSVDLQELLRFEDVLGLFFNGDISIFSEITLNQNLFLNFNFSSVNTIEIEVTNKSIKFQKLLLPSHETYYHSDFSDGKHIKNINSVDPKKDKYPFDYWEREDQRFIVKKYNFRSSNEYKASNDKTLVIPFGNNLNDVVEINQKLRKEIATYFRAYNQKLIFDKPKNELRVFWFLNDDQIFSIPIELVADSLKRLIFYKAAVLSNENTVLLFEEPEAHCYEPYILEFTNSVKKDENNNQFFIVTHSQYVIEEFLRDEKIRNDTNIYLVGLENNETQIKLLSQEMNKEIYQTGLNVFFNYQSLWNEISEHEAVH